MAVYEQEYEQETEQQVTGFDKLEETQALIKSLLSAPLTLEPSTDAEKRECDQLQALHRIVSRSLYENIY